MSNTVKYLIVGLVATVVWEFGHPYIPGLVVDHPHTHEEAERCLVVDHLHTHEEAVR